MAAQTHTLSRRNLLSRAAVAPAALAVPAAAVASPVPFSGGDEELFALIDAYRAEAARLQALCDAADARLSDVVNTYSGPPLQPWELPIYDYAPKSAEGAVALLDMADEFGRIEAKLMRWPFSGGMMVCQKPMASVRPILAALAGVAS